MSTADTNNPGLKLQDVGENLNTWGNPNLNNDFVVCSNLASKVHALAVSGDYSFPANTTNYATTNPDEVAVIKYSGSGLTGAFNATMANRHKRLIVWNTSGFTVTHKLPTSTGFSLPNNGIAVLATDGATDVWNVSPTHAGTATQAGDSNAYALWGAVQTAIAAASGLTAPFILNSGTDRTPGYHLAKHDVAFAGLLTGAYSTENPGVNERALLTLDDRRVRRRAMFAGF